MSENVVLFPGAGSFGGELQPLVNALAARLVRYPGRYGPDFGVPAGSFEELVRACTEQIAGWAPVRPVLFGHSFGAYVAYATALRMQEIGTEVVALMVAAADAPGRLTVPERATRSPRDAAVYLESVDPGVLAAAPSDDWREIVAETVVQDLRLLRQFDAASAAGVRCPVLAVRGEADPLTSDAGIREWKHSTDGAFSPRIFPGGHSDFLGSADCVSWIRGVLS